MAAFHPNLPRPISTHCGHHQRRYYQSDAMGVLQRVEVLCWGVTGVVVGPSCLGFRCAEHGRRSARRWRTGVCSLSRATSPFAPHLPRLRSSSPIDHVNRKAGKGIQVVIFLTSHGPVGWTRLSEFADRPVDPCTFHACATARAHPEERLLGSARGEQHHGQTTGKRERSQILEAALRSFSRRTPMSDLHPFRTLAGASAFQPLRTSSCCRYMRGSAGDRA